MTKKYEREHAALLTEHNAVVKMMAPSWTHDPDAIDVPSYVKALLNQIERQRKERLEVLSIMSDTWRESVESSHKTIADYVTMLKGDTNPELEGKNNGKK